MVPPLPERKETEINTVEKITDSYVPPTDMCPIVAGQLLVSYRRDNSRINWKTESFLLFSSPYTCIYFYIVYILCMEK